MCSLQYLPDIDIVLYGLPKTTVRRRQGRDFHPPDGESSSEKLWHLPQWRAGTRTQVWLWNREHFPLEYAPSSPYENLLPYFTQTGTALEICLSLFSSEGQEQTLGCSRVQFDFWLWCSLALGSWAEAEFLWASVSPLLPPHTPSLPSQMRDSRFSEGWYLHKCGIIHHSEGRESGIFCSLRWAIS